MQRATSAEKEQMMKVFQTGLTVLALSASAFSAGAQIAGEPAPQPAAPPTVAPQPAPKADGAKAKTPRVKGTSYVRVLHAIADAPAADVYLDGKIALTAVAFKDVSKYLPVPSGKHALKITATGKTDALLSGSANFAKDKFFTVAAYGEAAKPLLLNLNESTGAGESAKGKARVFALHLSPGTPAVDITTPSKNKLGYATFLAKLEYAKKRSKAAKPNTVTLQVRADGKVIKEIENVQLEADHRYSVFALGKVGGEGTAAFDVLVVPAATQ